MTIILELVAMQLILWMLKLIDGLSNIFSVLIGVENVNQENIIEGALSLNAVNVSFWCVFILSVALLVIFTISSIIKNTITAKEGIGSIVGKFFIALLGSVVALSLVLIVILISNSVLNLVNDIFNFTSGGSIVQSFINSCTGEWFNGFSSNEIDINTITVKDLLGEYDMVLGIAPTAWKYNGMVNPDSFLYLPGFLASFGITFCFIIASINLARRIYEIVLIYISMPLAFSTLPLDNGNRLKKWTGFLMQRILIGYGTIFSFNVFLLVMPYLSSIHLDSLSDLGNALFTLIIIVSGASLIPAGQSIFTKIFAESDAGLGYGKEAVSNTKRNAVMIHRDMKMSARSLFR